MKFILILFFLTLSLLGFSQEKKQVPFSDELQKEKLEELNIVTDDMSFARRERYLDSLQTAGVIIRKTISNKSKGCTLEDQEIMYREPKKEVIIFIEK